MHHTILESIATANPPCQLTTTLATEFTQHLDILSPALRDRAATIYQKSAIETRYTCIPDYLTTEPEQFTFFPQNWQLTPPPTTAHRNQLYRQYALKLAQEAAKEALQQSDRNPDEITHLIVVSCTGFYAPGLDVQLIGQLGLSPHTDRTLIGFMGCYAAFNAFKTAHAICQSNINARVLVVCVELCTLHFQAENTLESVIINALFGDGAAAAVFSSQSALEAKGKLAYIEGRSLLTENSLDLMSWTIGDTGFLMSLSSKVPQAIVSHLPNYLNNLLKHHHLTTTDITTWAIHPGGRQIVDQIQSFLELSPEQLQDSYEILRQYGNMSSCTILFILKRLLQHTDQNIIALAFGPGLTIEGCLFQQIQ